MDIKGIESRLVVCSKNLQFTYQLLNVLHLFFFYLYKKISMYACLIRHSMIGVCDTNKANVKRQERVQYRKFFIKNCIIKDAWYCVINRNILYKFEAFKSDTHD